MYQTRRAKIKNLHEPQNPYVKQYEICMGIPYYLKIFL